MLPSIRPVFVPSFSRLYSSTGPQKSTAKLVAELRKLTDVSISKAREALGASGNDVNAALEWLQKDLAISGAKKAAKVEGRVAGEGLISACVLSRGIAPQQGPGHGGIRAAMVELNCETDFVGRNELFGRLAADIAHTAAYISDPIGSETAFQPIHLDSFNDAPLLSQSDPQAQSFSTVGTAIRNLIAKVGEKIVLRRAMAVVETASQSSSQVGLRLTTYAHGSMAIPNQGRIGSLALLALKSPGLAERLASQAFYEDLEKLERSIARQIVGFDTNSVMSKDPADETALYNQPFMMYPSASSGQSVAQVLETWAKERGIVEDSSLGGLAVLEFRKWTVGEALDENL